MQPVDAIASTFIDNEPEKGGKQSHVLSCERCSRRKIKCDRDYSGCQNCKKARVPCNVVLRPRLPRGRRNGPGKVNSDLKARLLRLEGLVNSYAQQGEGASDASQSSDSPQTSLGSGEDGSHGNTPKGVSRYIGSKFWSGLGQEITEVREALDSSEDEDDARRESHSYPDGAMSGGYSLFGSPGDSQNTLEYELADVPTTSALCEIYLYRFSPVAKFGHGPSIRALMCGRRYLDYPPDHPACKLLTSAVCYGALETLTEPECRQRFATSKDLLRRKYKGATETLLARADLLTTSDLTVIEAFFIYILALRANDSSRKAWTLMATAVRIAQAIGLDRDDTHLNLRPFHREMRRRLWHGLRMADLRSAYDRGTDAMIFEDPYRVPFPANINDADFSFESQGPMEDRPAYTDITHSLVILAGASWRGAPFNHSVSAISGEHPTSPTRQQSIDLWRELEHKYLQHCDLRIDLHYFTRQCASTIAATALLFAARPVKGAAHKHAEELSSDSILLLAVDVLEKAQKVKTDPRLAAWDWYTFVPWHSIAVAVAELCVRPSGPVVDKAWPVVESAFKQYSSRVADSSNGMLWRPLVKLMSKAKKTRTSYLQQAALPVQENKTSSFEPLPVNGHKHGQQLQSSNRGTGPSMSQQTHPQAIDAGLNNLSIANNDDMDWFQSMVDQPPLSTETSDGRDQWNAFLQNMSTFPDLSTAGYGQNSQSWLGADGFSPSTFPMEYQQFDPSYLWSNGYLSGSTM